MTRHKFELFADYFQFYLQDEAAEGDLSDAWTEETVARSRVALAPGTVGVGTARNTLVPVTLDIRDHKPCEVSECDLVVEAALEMRSDTLVVAGCTDYFPDAARIRLRAGTYRVRVSFFGLEKKSDDGLSGEDRYAIEVWPSGVDSPNLEVLRDGRQEL